MEQDFYNFEGNLDTILHNIAEWIEKEQPTYPTMAIIEQGGGTIHIRIYYQ